MVHIIRNKMFETNSSSMHSLVIDNSIQKRDIETAPYSLDEIPLTLTDDQGNELVEFYDTYNKNKGKYDYTLTIRLDREPMFSYCRQSGSLIATPSEKLYMYVALTAIYYWNYGEDPKTYLDRLQEFVEKLKERIFDPMDLKFEVVLPEVVMSKSKYDENEINYDLHYLPSLEDSDGALKECWEVLNSDDSKLYSFLFSSRSFVIVGGDEYYTTDNLTSLLRRSINYDCTKFGSISWPEFESISWPKESES